jgi:ribosomal protein S18 acetylase RimI-like enzyme
MISVRIAEYGSPEYLAAVEIRREVLRRPLGLDYTVEQLAQDADKTILVALDGDEVVGTLMLTDEGNGRVRMRAVAVAPDRQKGGIGRIMVEESERVGASMGFSEMYLHARDHAIGFYERLGYQVEGEEFVEVTIPHRRMRKPLV